MSSPEVRPEPSDSIDEWVLNAMYQAEVAKEFGYDDGYFEGIVSYTETVEELSLTDKT